MVDKFRTATYTVRGEGLEGVMHLAERHPRTTTDDLISEAVRRGYLVTQPKRRRPSRRRETTR